MLIKYLGSGEARLNDKKLETGDELEVESREAESLIASGLFEAVKVKKKKTKKTDEELELGEEG
jgi:hypothetical protein